MTEPADCKLFGPDCGVCRVPVHGKPQYEEERGVETTRCHHVFHEECLRMWAEVYLICPTCGESLFEEEQLNEEDKRVLRESKEMSPEAYAVKLCGVQEKARKKYWDRRRVYNISLPSGRDVTVGTASRRESSCVRRTHDVSTTALKSFKTLYLLYYGSSMRRSVDWKSNPALG